MFYCGEGDNLEDENQTDAVNPYIPKIMNENVYITSLSFTYKAGFPELITGEISFIVGGNLNNYKANLTDGNGTATIQGYTG